nr:TPA_inf: bE [Pseudozyma hubeiensis]
MSAPSFSIKSLLHSLNEVENDFLEEAEGNSAALVNKLRVLHQETSEHIASIARDPDSIRQVHNAAGRIQLLADTFVYLDKQFVSLRAEMIRDASKCLQATEKVQSDPQDISENLPSYYMRKHFLETLYSPYPTQEEKEALVRITNESSAKDDPCSTSRPPLGVHQLTLWFINARRRSGWSHILKKFAREDRSRMKRLVRAKLNTSDLSTSPSPTFGHLPLTLDDILRDNLGRPLTSADKKVFEDDWASMISWIKYGVKGKVGDWVYDLVAANKKAPKHGKARTVNTAASRSPARKTATATQSKPRKAKQRASKTPSIESNTESERFESTPELSMCSTSDTSSSTLDSNLSMARYSPFDLGDDLLKSPSLNALNSRRVKALPKRGQKQLLDAMHTGDFPLTGTCYPVAEEVKPRASFEGHAQVAGAGDGQATSYLSAELSNFPPFDALGQVPMPVRRESLSSNSLSAAFC